MHLPIYEIYVYFCRQEDSVLLIWRLHRMEKTRPVYPASTISIVGVASMTHLKHQFRTQKRFQSATAIMTVVCPEHLSQILCDIDAKLAAINERLERQADLLSKIGTIVGTQKECRRCKTASRRKKKGRKLGKSSAETIGTIGERFDSHISRFSRGSSSTEPRHKRPQYIDPLSPWPDIIPPLQHTYSRGGSERACAGDEKFGWNESGCSSHSAD